ncbi:MAG: hypothetical protein J2P18_05165 [Nocardia sp.]|nr:hypothetical protein [Nocardia sp.]
MTLFFDGRVKVWSTTHLWAVAARHRHNALGEVVLLRPGREVAISGPTDRKNTPDIAVTVDAGRGHTVAMTVAGDNGTFVDFFHDSTIAVGNDGRDIDDIHNLGREATRNRTRNGIGGSVILTFKGSYRPRTLRKADHYVKIPELSLPPAFRLYQDEFEVS